MPSKQQLEQALRNAHNAGDTNAARRLAAAIKGGEFDQPREDTTDSFVDNTLDVLGEFAAASNRTVTEFLDFLGPDTANAILGLAGSDKRVPTLTESKLMQKLGIQGGFMEPGTTRDVVQAAGKTLPIAAGMKQVPGRDITTIRGAAADILGAGSAATAPVKAAATTSKEMMQQTFPSKARQQAKLPLLRQSGDVSTAGFKMDDAGRVVDDEIQKRALKAGVDKGTVAMLASANPSTKSSVREMLTMIQRGLGNTEYRNFNPPARVVGKSIKGRLSSVIEANKQAGSQIDAIAKGLKNKPIDVSAPVETFLGRLSSEGIGVNLQTGRLTYEGSSIEKLPKAQRIISNVFNRLYNTADPTQDAYRVHLAKRFIDENVSYGKTQGGLSGKMEGIIKALRRDLDGQLDSMFPEYDRVNTVYKETRGIIDEVQNLAGRKVNLYGENVDKALGTMSRKVLSNYQSGTAMEDMFTALDSIARKYGSNLDDDLFKLVSTEAEMRRMFPSVEKPNTFGGGVARGTAHALADASVGNKVGLGQRALKTVGEAFGKSQEKQREEQLKALLELVK